MAWLFSPWGIGIVVVVIVVIASFIFWKRAAIKKWFRSRKVGAVEVGLGPVKVTLAEKDKPQRKTERSRAGVHFGEGGDFRGAKVKGVAGRDIRKGDAAAAKSAGGKTPGVDFGKKGKFDKAEIEDVAGRDLVED